MVDEVLDAYRAREMFVLVTKMERDIQSSIKLIEKDKVEKLKLINLMEQEIDDVTDEYGWEVAPEVHAEVCRMADVLLAEAKSKGLRFNSVLKLWKGIRKEVNEYLGPKYGYGEKLDLCLRTIRSQGERREFFSSNMGIA